MSLTCRIAFDELDFLVRDEMRGVRLQLELMKPELELQAQNMNSTIVIFGSARAADPSENSDDPLGKYYAEARLFASIVWMASQSDRKTRLCRGGRRRPKYHGVGQPGADKAGLKCVGLNITPPTNSIQTLT